jgi:putative copper export protein
MRTIVELFIRCIHLVAAMIWFGGILFSAIIATPILRRNLSPVESLQHTSAIRDRLRSVIRVIIHVLLITGAMNIVIVGLNTKMDFSRNYIVFFIVKMGFVALMALFHILHVSVFGRKLEAAVTELRSTDTTVPPVVARLQRQTQLFAILTMLSGLAVFIFALSLKGA